MPKKRVLIVDDNFVVRSMVRQLFELESDFEVSGEAENGIEALQKAAALNPDLVILDLSMPVMSGLDAAPQLMKLLPAARIMGALEDLKIDELGRRQPELFQQRCFQRFRGMAERSWTATLRCRW